LEEALRKEFPGRDDGGIVSLIYLQYFNGLPGEVETKLIRRVNLTLMRSVDFPICVELVGNLVSRRVPNNLNFDLDTVADSIASAYRKII